MLGVASVFVAVWLSLFRNRMRYQWLAVIVITLLSMVLGVASVKLFAFLECFGEAYNGSISLFGAVFFMPFAFAVGAKVTHRPVRDVFDVLTIPLVFTLILTRVNCLRAGCCYGIPIHGTGLRYPTREAEIVFYLGFLLIEAPKVYKNETFGEVYPLYMMSYGIFRAVVECFRHSASADGLFHVSHVWAILSFGIGASIYIELKRQRKIRSTRKR